MRKTQNSRYLNVRSIFAREAISRVLYRRTSKFRLNHTIGRPWKELRLFANIVYQTATQHLLVKLLHLHTGFHLEVAHMKTWANFDMPYQS